MDVKQLADTAGRIAVEDDDFVMRCAASEAGGVGFGRAFAQDLLAGADKRGVFGDGDAVDDFEQALVAFAGKYGF